MTNNEHLGSIRPVSSKATLIDRELVRRAISALFLGGVALLALWVGGVIFAALVAGIAVVMSWEWGRMVRGVEADGTFLLHATSVIAAVGLTVYASPWWPLGMLLVGGIAIFIRQNRFRPWLSAAGLFYVGLPAIALVWFREQPAYGTGAVLFILLAVWAHDTFAMLVGKSLRGPRLWPTLSPNKTWAGLIGGLVASAGVGWGVSLVADTPHMLVTIAFGLILGAAAFAGDLAESALKRRYDIKNASDLIPGHGGFMDRMDGIVTAALVAVVLGVLANAAAPAAGLLFLQ